MATPEEVDYIQNLEAELQQARGDKSQLQQGQMNLFQPEEQDNLIRWQLDLKEDLDRIYHLLKGERIGEDEEGNITWMKSEDEDLMPFNEFGVQLLMNIMAFYLNRNTILSNYDDATIKWKVHDFGIEISDLIHNRYEEMMLTIKWNKENETKLEFEQRGIEHIKKKLKLYPMIVRELVDSVHSAYLRAYHGGERESLRTARTVTQSEPLGMNKLGGQQQGFSNQKKFSLNPLSWVRR